MQYSYKVQTDFMFINQRLMERPKLRTCALFYAICTCSINSVISAFTLRL